MTANQAKNGPVIEMEGVTKQFGDNIAVRDVTLEMPAAKIFGVVGPSGCGKTTTIRMLTGVYRPTKGRLRVLGASPEAFERRVRERIGYMPQLFVLYPTLTIWENLNFVASLYGLTWFKRRKHLERLLEFVELTPARNSLAGDVSGGMKRRLELACSLVNDPELLFADEPTAGVDPVLRGKFWDRFRELKGQGHSLVVTTQYVSEVAYCDQVAVMRNGKLLTVDTPNGLRRRALGGEIIRLTVDADDEINARQILQRIDFVRFFRRPDNAEQGVLDIHVDNAGRSLPDLIKALNQDTSIDMRKAEEYLPPFDDIFVILMERAAKEDPESAEEHIINA